MNISEIRALADKVLDPGAVDIDLEGPDGTKLLMTLLTELTVATMLIAQSLSRNLNVNTFPPDVDPR